MVPESVASSSVSPESVVEQAAVAPSAAARPTAAAARRVRRARRSIGVDVEELLVDMGLLGTVTDHHRPDRPTCALCERTPPAPTMLRPDGAAMGRRGAGIWLNDRNAEHSETTIPGRFGCVSRSSPRLPPLRRGRPALYARRCGAPRDRR